MNHVDLKNQEVLNLLYKHSEWILESEILKQFESSRKQPSSEEVDRIISPNELDEVKQDPNHIGHPLDSYLFSLQGLKDLPNKEGSMMREFDQKFKTMLGSSYSPLHVIYPENGFISWHTNENCAGKSVLFTYSSDGLGFFRYQDPVTNEIITMQDPKGWSAKLNDFGSTYEKRVWHCARAYGIRISIDYMIYDEVMWNDLKEELEEK